MRRVSGSNKVARLVASEYENLQEIFFKQLSASGMPVFWTRDE
jgi:hypothetical protein